MRRPNTSSVALCLAGLALFISLGGPAWATSLLRKNSVTSAKIAPGAVHASDIAKRAVTNSKLGVAAVSNTKLKGLSVTTSKLADGSVSTPKLADGSVSTGKLGDTSVTTGKLADASVATGKLANDAVTSSKVADASLTASDIATDTFLPFDGTAVDSTRLGGVLPSGYVRGNAQTGAARIVVPDGDGRTFLLSLSVGFLAGSCTSNVPTLSFEPNFNDPNFSVSAQSGATTRVDTANALTPSTHFDVPPGTGPQVATFQIGVTTGGTDHVATAVATAQHLAGTGCVFTAQGVWAG